MGMYVERAAALRNHPTIHYNCAQSVLVAFADKMGYTEEEANKLGAHLGAGARHGSICGALSGALIVLGALGYGEREALEMLKNFRKSHGDTDCRVLLRTSLDRGEEKKCHCDGLVTEMAAVIEGLLEV